MTQARHHIELSKKVQSVGLRCHKNLLHVGDGDNFARCVYLRLTNHPTHIPGVLNARKIYFLRLLCTVENFHLQWYLASIQIWQSKLRPCSIVIMVVDEGCFDHDCTIARHPPSLNVCNVSKWQHWGFSPYFMYQNAHTGLQIAKIDLSQFLLSVRLQCRALHCEQEQAILWALHVTASATTVPTRSCTVFLQKPVQTTSTSQVAYCTSRTRQSELSRSFII